MNMICDVYESFILCNCSTISLAVLVSDLASTATIDLGLLYFCVCDHKRYTTPPTTTAAMAPLISHDGEDDTVDAVEVDNTVDSDNGNGLLIENMLVVVVVVVMLL